MNAVAGDRIVRVGNGMAWNTLASLGTHAINLGRVMVVARMLAPEHFGVFGMALVVLLGLQSMGEFGLKEAFIAHEQNGRAERERWLNAVWTGNLAIKSAVALLLVLLAWPAARLYGHPELFPMLCVLALVPVCTALVNPALFLMEKRLQFGRVAAFELSIAAVAFVATVVLAWLTGSAWALILGYVIGVAAGAAISYVLDPFRPRPGWDSETIYRAMHFGKYMVVVMVCTTAITQLDNLVIGAQLGAAALGFYIIAYRIAEIPKLVIASVTARSLFPYYSETLLDGRAQLATAWQLASGYVVWLVLAAYIPIALCAEYYVVLLFGEQWRAAAPLLVVLTLLGAARGIGRTMNSVIMAIRKPNVEALLKVVEVALFVPAIFAGLALTGSAVGVAWAAVAAATFTTLARFVYVLPNLGIAPLAYLQRLARPAAGGVAMAAAAAAVMAANWHPILLTLLLWLVWLAAFVALEPEMRRWLWQRRRRLTAAFA